MHVDGLELITEVRNPEDASTLELEIQREDTITKDISEGDSTLTYQLGDPETIGTTDQRLHHQTEFTARVRNEAGENPRSMDWRYQPDIELTDVVKSEEVGYEPEQHTIESTPVLEFTNTGSGPTRLQRVIVRNIRSNVPLRGSNDETSFGHSAIMADWGGDNLTPVDPHEYGHLYIAEGESVYFAIDGMFTHSGDQPESVESNNQIFNVGYEWLFGDDEYRIVANLNGGIESSDGPEQYQFRDYTIESVETASPL